MWVFHRAFSVESFGRGDECEGGIPVLKVKEALPSCLLLQIEECTRQLQNAVQSVHSICVKDVEERCTALETMVHDGLRSIQVTWLGELLLLVSCQTSSSFKFVASLVSFPEDHWDSNAMWPPTDHC